MKNKILIQMFEEFEKELRSLAEEGNTIALSMFKEWKALNTDAEKMKFIREVDSFSVIRSSDLVREDHLPKEYKS